MSRKKPRPTPKRVLRLPELDFARSADLRLAAVRRLAYEAAAPACSAQSWPRVSEGSKVQRGSLFGSEPNRLRSF